MSAPALRLGVVGAGSWARSSHLPSLREHAGARLVAVANSSLESARAVAEQFGFEHADEDWHALLARDDLDALLITAPAVEHAPVCLAAVERGLHVLCEAPLATSLSDGRAMCAAAEECGVVTGYVRPRPFLAGGEAVRELLSTGALGKLRRATLGFRWNPWLLEDPEQSWRVRRDPWPPVLAGVVSGMLAELLGPITRVSGSLDVIGPAASHPERAANQLDALMETESGVLVTAHAGWSPLPVPFSGLSLFGESGALVWEWTPPFRIQLCQAGAQSWEERPPGAPGDLSSSWTATREFVDAALAGRSAPLNLRRGLHELEVIAALERSQQSGSWEDVGGP